MKPVISTKLIVKGKAASTNNAPNIKAAPKTVSPQSKKTAKAVVVAKSAVKTSIPKGNKFGNGAGRSSAFRTPNLNGWNDDKSYEYLDEFKSRNSAYLQSLLNPWSNFGIGIPNFTLDSVKISVTQRITVTVDVNGRAFFFWGIASGGVTGSGMSDAHYMLNHAYLGPEADSLTVMDAGNNPPTVEALSVQSPVQGTYSTGTSAIDSTNPFLLQASGANATSRADWDFPAATKSFLAVNFTGLRVVSAGFTINSTASSLDNKGLLTLVSLPRTFYSNSVPLGRTAGFGGVSITDFANPFAEMAIYPNSVVVPLNKGVGGTVRYFPYDPPTMTYCNTSDAENSEVSPTYDPESIPDEYRPGFLLAKVEGAAPATVLIIDIICNLEGLPSNNTLLQTATTGSIHDDMELDHAQSICERTPPAFAGSEMSSKTDGYGGNNGHSGIQAEGSRSIMDGVALHNRWIFNSGDHVIQRVTNSSEFVKHVTPGPQLGKSFMKKMGSIAGRIAPTIRMIDKIVTKFSPVLAHLASVV